ncbi:MULTISPECIES: plasmid replication initiator TrfA [Pseudomonas syringae group]|uniref:TrfA-related protein n=1 Tax=Pseudomonas syringae pv. actinidiae TaxID=103796 RepID=A0A7L7TGH7_PSESF|nr:MULTISPECIES: plasmid replication initiator TrfA [Pseudomonas syringae group]QOC74180.1 TrfA-related protein [Pseudomonas syringae pv. actinidiae]
MNDPLHQALALERRAADRTASKASNLSLELFAQGDLLPPVAELDNSALPEWSDSVRGVPNAIIRGALFAAIQGKTRRYMKGEVIEQGDGMTIRFTGMQLDQSDLDVWETLIHISRHTPKGEKFYVHAGAILSYLGRPRGGDHYRWLHESIDRMVSGAVRITFDDRYSYSSTMLKTWKDGLTQEYFIQLDEQLLSLYSLGWTQINWAQRDALRGKPVALWLHGWYCSHTSPEDISIARIQQLCGSSNRNRDSFKTKVRAALEEIKNIGAIANFNISRNGVVHVERYPLNTLSGF